MVRPDQGPGQASEMGDRQAFVLSAFRAFTAQTGASGHPHTSYGVRVVAGPRGFTLTIPLLGLAIMVRPDQGPGQASERGERRSFVLSAFQAFTAQTGASGRPHTSYGVRVVAGPRGFTLTIPLLGVAIMVRPDQGPG